MKTGLIYTIDLVIISATALVLLFLFNNTSPMIIAPLNEEKMSSSAVLFSFKNAEYILIDDNIEFTSPEKIFVKDNLLINLEPGIYYWKIKGIRESEIRKLAIISRVDLRLKQSEENDSINNNFYEVINAGTEKLNVDVYENESITGMFILDTEASMNNSGDKFIGGKA
jgi:hypothetical protein